MTMEQWHNIAEAVAPVVYGTLGACVFLLRSLHVHIYDRTFDRRRKPEYVNRIVLGTVCGGVIVLFSHAGMTSPQGAELGAPALGFLAGYNTDLLFSFIERISNAFFPKTPDPAK
jgi:hypothetical protein